MIYESRPNVTIDAPRRSRSRAVTPVSRGGSEAVHLNRALAVLVRAPAEAGSAGGGGSARGDDRPRGGGPVDRQSHLRRRHHPAAARPDERISRESKVPVIKHLDGNCHVYVDAPVDLEAGAARDRQREDAEAQPVQCRRVAARARGERARLPAADRRDLRRQGRRDALRRGGGGLLRDLPAPNVVPATEADWTEEYPRRSSASRSSPGWTRRSRTSTATARTTPTPSSPSTTPTRCASCARSTRRA